MNDYFIFFVYFLLAFIGLIFHFFANRKKYFTCSFLHYLTGEIDNTANTIIAISSSVFALTLSVDVNDWYAIKNVGMAIGAGFIADNLLNKAPPN